MWKRLLVALVLLVSAVNARAVEYTDVYVDADPAQSGWGAFLVQSDTFQFIAFFIYGPDNQPIWYTGQLTDDGTGKYTGAVYRSIGTYFAVPWNPADHPVPSPQIGIATFQPIDSYNATLTYTIGDSGAVTKSVTRQTLTSYKMAGNYSGSMAGSVSGCTDPNDPRTDPMFRARYGLTVGQSGDASATLVFTFVDTTHAGIVCTATGPLTHFGRLYQMGPGTTLTCTGPGQDGKTRVLTIDSLHPTGQGIEGKLTGDVGGGCTASLHFAAVLTVNN